MSFFFSIIALFIKQLILPGGNFLLNFLGSNYFLSRVSIYFMILIIIISIRKGIPKNLFSSKVSIYLFIILFLQGLSMIFSHQRIGDSIYNIDPIKNFILFIFFIALIFVHYLVVKLTIRDMKDINQFINGHKYALIILLIICSIQGIYLITPIVSNVVGLLGTILEDRNLGNLEYYYKGSYVQTLERINGLNSEAGYLATQLLVIFIPFILSSIKNKINMFSKGKKYKPVRQYFALMLIIIILFFAKTTTGMVAILLIGVSLFLSLSLRRKLILFYPFIFLVGVGIVLYYSNNYVYDILNSYLFEKTEAGSSADNRLGGTIALVLTYIHHFIIGIGWDYHVYYLFKYVPDWSTQNNEYLMWLNVRHRYPVLNLFFGLLAQLGTLSMVIIISYIYRLMKFYRKLSIHVKKFNPAEYRFVKGLGDSFHFFIIFALVISMVTFYQWYSSAYLIVFFFFVTLRSVLSKHYNISNKLK